MLWNPIDISRLGDRCYQLQCHDARRVLCVLEELHLTHLTGERQYNYQFVQPDTKNILGSERLFDLEVVGSKEDIEKEHEGEKRK